MKRLFPATIASLFAVLVACSCASKPPAPSTPAVAAPEAAAPKVPEKVAKQRTVVTKAAVLVKESSFYSDGLPDQYAVYKLDEAKKNTLEKDLYDASRPDPVQRSIYEYKDGRLAAESIYEGDGKLRVRRELAYDAEGRVARERSLDSSGKTVSTSIYTYDPEGRRTEWKVLDASDVLKADTFYSYGPDGLTGLALMDVAGRLTGSIKLEYAGGKLVKRSYFGDDGVLQKYEAYAYARDRLESVELRLAGGAFVSKTAYEYGPLGETVKALEYDASGAPGNYSTYEYVVREDSKVETYYE